MIKINKQLKRPDGGTVTTGSLVKYNPTFVPDSLTIIYTLKHYFSQSALDSGKLCIPAVTDFAYRMNKVCTQAEYDQLKLADADLLVQTWLQGLIENSIGVGNTELV